MPAVKINIYTFTFLMPGFEITFPANSSIMIPTEVNFQHFCMSAACFEIIMRLDKIKTVNKLVVFVILI